MGVRQEHLPPGLQCPGTAHAFGQSPGELRVAIYGFYFKPGYVIADWSTGRLKFEANSLAILRVNRPISAETLACLYDKCTFCYRTYEHWIRESKDCKIAPATKPGSYSPLGPGGIRSS